MSGSSSFARVSIACAAAVALFPLGSTGCSNDDSGGSASVSGTVQPPSGVTVVAGSTDVAPGSYGSLKMTVNGEARTYGLFVPATYTKGTALPLIFGFHGDGGTGAGFRSSFPIEAVAKGAALFVYPDGTNDNDGHSFDQDDDPPKNHDVDFFDAMLSTLSNAYSVDTSRVYITGMSGGAYFTNQLARWRESEVWGNAPQSGGGPFGNGDSDFTDGNLTVNGPVPSLIIHGSADSTVDISEGEKSLTYWGGANGCSGVTPKSGTAHGTSPCLLEPGCSSPVVWCEIPGMNHTIWTDAPTAIWSFFSSLQGKR
jgi:polyhydroxybutyrate depolymerase